MKGMDFLVQSKLPISRPDDFFAEMLKTDSHMTSVKSRILRQQTKIQSFEEKKQRTDNKKFHKAIKDFKMKAKHAEKRENLDQIQKLKKRVQERGDDMDDADYDKIMKPGGRGGKGKKQNVIGTVKEKVHQQKRQKQKFKKEKQKRPGKVTRQKGKR